MHGGPIEIEVLPGEAERFAHPPTLHVTQGHGGGEPLIGRIEQAAHIDRTECETCHLGDPWRANLRGRVVLRQPEFDALVLHLHQEHAHVARPGCRPGGDYLRNE